MTTAIIYAVCYAAGLTFVVACVVRAIRYARMPLHLRWELYPVPHEDAAQARHGGSYFELTDWWTRPRHYNLSGEMGSMFAEMLFLRGLWEFKRKLWYRSYPFHLGLYFLAGALALLLLTALQSLIAPAFVPAPIDAILHDVYSAAWLAGSALTLLGAVGLLMMRLTDERLKPYTTPGDVFNLLFFIVTLGLLASAYFLRPATSPSARAMVRAVLTFDTSLKIPGLLAAGVVAGSLLVAYIPLTHMSHFIAKYFTYHAVRWDDRATMNHRNVEAKIAEYLTYRPTWSAPHVGANGHSRWADVATTIPPQGGKK